MAKLRHQRAMYQASGQCLSLARRWRIHHGEGGDRVALRAQAQRSAGDWDRSVVPLKLRDVLISCRLRGTAGAPDLTISSTTSRPTASNCPGARSRLPDSESGYVRRTYRAAAGARAADQIAPHCTGSTHPAAHASKSSGAPDMAEPHGMRCVRHRSTYLACESRAVLLSHARADVY